jgi:glycosyltransferase involved in cell wall biosynthesis
MNAPIPKISIVIPAKNEAQGLSALLQKITSLHPDAEVVVVDDGSSDDTADIAQQAGAHVVSHPYSMGNGAAIKNGARAARGGVLLFMDADGQHDPADIRTLIQRLESGYDMVVGARFGSGQASMWRGLANRIYNWLASRIVGHPIMDLTSGFRAVRAPMFHEFLHLLPNGFSYPTTITMAFFRAGYRVAYEPITVHRRLGKSHIRPLQDGIRFLLIIFKVGTLYSPLKIFVPISATFFMTSVGYYLYTFLTVHRFTNMSALLFITSVLIFLIGLVSEQITSLLYAKSGRD